MSFTLEIKTSNAAFSSPYTGDEVARILREVADRILNGDTEGRTIDINGNGVGSFALEYVAREEEDE